MRAKKSANRKGFYLVSALVISLVIALFVSASLKLSIGNLKANSAQDKVALFAAESGLRYVQARLSEDYAWSADGGLVVDSPDMVVREDSGNIVGIVRADGGGFAQFRVRFNYQDDGQGDADGIPDSVLDIDSRWVSVNNLLGGSPFPVPRADGPSFSVTTASARDYDVPTATACVIVEGRFGPGLTLSSNSLNPDPNGVVSTRVIEAFLEAGAGPGADSAAMAAGDILFGINSTEPVTLEGKTKAIVTRIRSRGTIEVQGPGSPNLAAPVEGETYSSDGSLQASPNANISLLTEDTSQEFYQLNWSEVRKADPTGPSLSAGTYVLWDNGELHYYDMDYQAYETFIEADPGNAGVLIDPSSLPTPVTLDLADPSKPRIVIEDDVYIVATANTDEFSFIPRAGAQEDPPDAAGGGGSQDESQMASAVLGSLSASPDASGSGSGVTSGPEAASWIVPNLGGISGEIRAESGSWNGGTWRGVVLRDIGGGQAQLIVDSGYQPLFSPSITQNPYMALTDGITNQFAGDPEMLQILSAILGSGAGTEEMRELELASEPANLRADDLTVEFRPPDGESAILSSEGTIRLGSNVRGDGGSITSGATIRLVGNGTQLSASLADGLTLYAREDVVLSSLKERTLGTNNWDYKDVTIKGVLYAWSDIEVKTGHDDPSVLTQGAFSLQGAMVAYGGDPQNAPGSGGGGNITVKADESHLKYDPVYLVQMNTLTPNAPLNQTMYIIHR
jgi:hypothetical protein